MRTSLCALLALRGATWVIKRKNEAVKQHPRKWRGSSRHQPKSNLSQLRYWWLTEQQQGRHLFWQPPPSAALAYRRRHYLLPGCGAVGQRVAQPMRLWCCALQCRGALTAALAPGRHVLIGPTRAGVSLEDLLALPDKSNLNT